MKEWYLRRLVIYAGLILFLFAMIVLMYLEVEGVTNEHVQSQKICLSGFQYDTTLNKCIDINECEEFKCQTCPKKICQNIIGGFECNEPKCPPGYRIHSTFRKSHVNKCVRKRCKRAEIGCENFPRYKTFKSFHISPKMSGVVNDGLDVHKIFMKRFAEGAKIDVVSDGCIGQDSFELKHEERSVHVILKNPHEIQKMCEPKMDEISMKIHISNKETERLFELVDVTLKFSS